MSHLEAELLNQMQDEQLPEPVREHRFSTDRKWRFDFAWPNQMLAVEVEGGTRVNGRHNRHSGFQGDCEKYNHATLMGWRVLRYTGDMVRSGEAVAQIRFALLSGKEAA